MFATPSRRRRAAAVVGGALDQLRFAQSILSQGAHPSGIVSVAGCLGHDGFIQLAQRFRDFAGTANAARALILDQGIKWESLSISPEDQELLASRRFTGEELCRIYNVPPPIVGDLTHGTFTNSDTSR